MAYFTEPMAEEFRKAIEDALKEAPEAEDLDAPRRAGEGKGSSQPTKNSRKPSRSKRKKARRPRKKFSPKVARSLR